METGLIDNICQHLMSLPLLDILNAEYNEEGECFHLTVLDFSDEGTLAIVGRNMSFSRAYESYLEAKRIETLSFQGMMNDEF